MQILTKNDFDRIYFGADERFKDKAGYNPEYCRNSTFEDIAIKLNDRFNLKNKRVLDLGCAHGYLVKSLRDLGVEAYGFDWSDYAISQREEENHYLIEGDVMKDLKKFPDDRFDLIISFKFLSCIPVMKVKGLVLELNRISKRQYHEIDTKARKEFYNIQPVCDWTNYEWAPGTILTNNENKKEVVI